MPTDGSNKHVNANVGSARRIAARRQCDAKQLRAKGACLLGWIILSLSRARAIVSKLCFISRA
eukprot:1777572-Lingulodinium_polyedra.AAC.1